MKVNFSAFKDMSVGALKMAGFGLLFSVFVGVGSMLTAPFGIVGMLGLGAWIGGGCLGFYKPIKRNYERMKTNAVRFGEDLSGSRTRVQPVKTQTRSTTPQPVYTISPTADKSVKNFLKKQEKAQAKEAQNAAKNADRLHREAVKQSEKEMHQESKNPNVANAYGRKSFWQEVKDTFRHDKSLDVTPPTPALMEQEEKERREKLLKTLKGLAQKVLPKRAPKAPEAPQKKVAETYQPKGAYKVVDRQLEVSAATLEKYRSRGQKVS